MSEIRLLSMFVFFFEKQLLRTTFGEVTSVGLLGKYYSYSERSTLVFCLPNAILFGLTITSPETSAAV